MRTSSSSSIYRLSFFFARLYPTRWRRTWRKKVKINTTAQKKRMILGARLPYLIMEKLSTFQSVLRLFFFFFVLLPLSFIRSFIRHLSFHFVRERAGKDDGGRRLINSVSNDEAGRARREGWETKSPSKIVYLANFRRSSYYVFPNFLILPDFVRSRIEWERRKRGYFRGFLSSRG